MGWYKDPMHTRGHWGYASFLLLVLPFSLLSVTVRAEAPLEVECGFEGYVKADKWFPVRVSPVVGAAALDVYLMERDFGGGSPQVRMRFDGVIGRDGDERGHALCRHSSDSWGTPLIRCEVRRRDGTVTRKDVPIEVLSGNDSLVLVVSDKPEEFNFLGSIEQRDRGVVRVVSCSPADFPSHWQELDAIDVVVLDGPTGHYTAEQKRAVARWVVAGGTVILTDRALRLGRDGGCWGLGPARPPEPEYRQVAGDAFKPLIGKHAAFLDGVRALQVAFAGGTPVLDTADLALLAGRDVGRGRTILFGVDWRDLQLKDRAAFEPVRQALWARVLELRRPTERRELPTSLVFPKEAKVDFLMKPLAAFLIVYVILLGPVNWLVLRALRKLEYSVFTLPAGAVLFAVSAFFIGVSLRTAEPVLHEAEILVPGTDGAAVVSGVGGLLSPDQRAYRVALPAPDAMLDEMHERYASRSRKPRPGDLLTYGFRYGPWISNVRIDTWSMRFFQSESIEELKGGVTAVAVCERDALKGRIESRLPFVLRDAYVMHGWNRVGIGDVAPGTNTEFTLKLALPGREVRQRCPRCHRYHGGVSWFSAEFCKRAPLPENLRDFLEKLNGGPFPAQAFVVGWQDVAGNRLQIDSKPFHGNRQRLCFIPVKLAFDGPDVLVPAGVAASMGSPSAERPLAEGDFAQLPYRMAVWNPDEPVKNESTRRPRSIELVGDESAKGATYDFYLPLHDDALESRLLTVFWDLGEPDPDYPAAECALSAYDWESGSWQELARATEGTHETHVATPGRFVKLPYPVIRMRVAPVKPDKQTRYNLNYLEIAYEGHKRDGSGGNTN